ncbi:hypothetical protein CC77DRAFT_1048292 [Alternaria alternata]|uniref:F-box domain-containing protein n=1 Tax=Alternaria alternata TaxID=5599 RepID=A0A177DWM5_ALTAL|nr:hypothetical protein CC77DRAFT_1048292 [Alternaria alternata]OAG23402.1 hypothetical protein CC77DRAFT_1048292 [Alternaria alternata]
MVDTAFTVFIAKAIHYQIGYTPQKLKACHDPVGLELRRPPGTNESFFAAAGRLNETVASPTQMCVEFVKEMQIGIACCFFCALLSFLGYISTFVSARQMRRDNESILDLMKEVSTMAVRSGRRCVAKTAIGAGQKVEIMLSEVKNGFTKSKDLVEPYRNSYGTHTPLAQFLGVYDMLVMVTEHLHYTDVISLSTVSKSVRQAVLPSNEISRRLAMFRLYTCEPDKKTNCWSCTNQICESCEVDFPVLESVASRHIENCIPYCASCYRHRKNRHFSGVYSKEMTTTPNQQVLFRLTDKSVVTVVSLPKRSSSCERQRKQ